MNAGAIVEHTETGDIGRVVEVWLPFERVHFEPMVRVYWILTRGRTFHPESRERLVRTAVLRPRSGDLL